MEPIGHIPHPLRFDTKLLTAVIHQKSLLVEAGTAHHLFVLGIIQPDIPFHHLILDPDGNDPQCIRKWIIQNPITILHNGTFLVKGDLDRNRLIQHILAHQTHQRVEGKTHGIFWLQDQCNFGSGFQTIRINIFDFSRSLKPFGRNSFQRLLVRNIPRRVHTPVFLRLDKHGSRHHKTGQKANTKMPDGLIVQLLQLKFLAGVITSPDLGHIVFHVLRIDSDAVVFHGQTLGK